MISVLTQPPECHVTSLRLPCRFGSSDLGRSDGPVFLSRGPLRLLRFGQAAGYQVGASWSATPLDNWLSPEKLKQVATENVGALRKAENR
jgi:hypothetical protein